MNIKVMVDGLDICATEIARIFWIPQIAEVHNVCYGVASRGWTDFIDLVKLIVDENVLMPVFLSE
jgi:hypothetical protein